MSARPLSPRLHALLASAVAAFAWWSRAAVAFVGALAALVCGPSSADAAPSMSEGPGGDVDRAGAELLALEALWACSLDLEASAEVGPLRSEPPPAEPAPCAPALDDPLAPAPLCDPDAATGVAAAFVRGVADDRLEASGCDETAAEVLAFLGEREPDPSAGSQPAIDPACLAAWPSLSLAAWCEQLPETPYPGARAEGVALRIDRPPTRG